MSVRNVDVSYSYKLGELKVFAGGSHTKKVVLGNNHRFWMKCVELRLDDERYQCLLSRVQFVLVADV